VKKGDVVNAFQRTRNTQGTIYAELCEGIELLDAGYRRETHVMKLHHAINGTKQSGHEFNEKLNHMLTAEMKLKRLNVDPCVYTRGSEDNDNQIIVVCHVDDYQYVGMNDSVERRFEQEMNKHLPSQSGVECTEHLGVCVAQRDHETYLSQQNKIEDYCREFGLATPTRKLKTMNFNHTASSPMKDCERYPKAIGFINYLTQISRPDIMPVGSLLASYTRNPTEANWKGVMNLFSYLLATKNRRISYPMNAGRKQPIKIEAYCDASYNSPNENLTKRKTQSRAGYLVMIRASPPVEVEAP
jgi:hypothetical protein